MFAASSRHSLALHRGIAGYGENGVQRSGHFVYHTNSQLTCLLSTSAGSRPTTGPRHLRVHFKNSPVVCHQHGHAESAVTCIKVTRKDAKIAGYAKETRSARRRRRVLESGRMVNQRHRLQNLRLHPHHGQNLYLRTGNSSRKPRPKAMRYRPGIRPPAHLLRRHRAKLFDRCSSRISSSNIKHLLLSARRNKRSKFRCKASRNGSTLCKNALPASVQMPASQQSSSGRR